ncbi:MAG: HAMP domain-containing protein [Myxococcales bacterium]|nr:HAMP domain-containing protein [Myxococcales bacterium]
MRLAPRLVIAFGVVTTLSVAGLGAIMRLDRRETETRRFEQEVRSACDRVVAEIRRQGESDRKLVGGACQSGELVDRALISLEAGTLDDWRLALSRLVPEERQAFDLDELLLATTEGEVLGQDPMPALNTPRAEIAKVVSGDPAHFFVRTDPSPALVSRCRKAGTGGRGVALVGTRKVAPLLDRLGNTIDAIVTVGAPGATKDDLAQWACALDDAAGNRIPIVVSKPKTELVESLARVDQTVGYATLASAGVALVLAFLLARSLGRPIAELASEARKVASGEARPLEVRGPREIAELAQAFDKMLEDLEATRRRLDATSRVAAWREVARRIAHEVKNPLAPIRAAVETLRRLRARHDPEFESYFDEATRTVLDEVHRLSNMVTEFTRFARLAAPHPQPVDVPELARQLVRLHEAGTPARLEVVVERAPPVVRADRDQLVQVLTNLLQNALDAVAAKGEAGHVELAISAEGDARVAVTVTDNGPGVAAEIAPRIFEPYATTKPQGTGLGLAIAQRIAIEHDGELSYVAGGAGKGASFRLVLSVAGPPAVPGEMD